MAQSYAEGSVRVDLIGGTLDLPPINLILPNAITLNLATSLKAKVKIQAIDNRQIKIISKDYNSITSIELNDLTEKNFNSNKFGNFNFVLQIIAQFNLDTGIEVELESGSPPGAGLGGSSSMGITLYKALADFVGIPLVPTKALEVVRNIENKILDSGPAGYQDYYPALYGGILALIPSVKEIEVKQLYDQRLCKVLNDHMTLVYSGQTRLSGINNWEVYKAFFDKNQKVRKGLGDIASISKKFLESIEANQLGLIPEYIKEEGQIRESLFPNIVTNEMRDLLKDIQKIEANAGIKVCGAGGGGCFLIVHQADSQSKVAKIINDHKMQILEFDISKPLALYE
ncbi:MAG: hypothetical protein H6622_07490 [Halobacteriovoraceae bacterium]|nr:hypothetical protein [Halobacteriovoraceae bacterium]